MARPKGSTNKVSEDNKVVEDNLKNVSEIETSDVKSITENITEKVTKAKTDGVTKVVKKVFDDEDLVPVATFVGGLTRFTNPIAPFERYVWGKFGDIEQVRFGALKGLKQRRSSAFKEMLYVLDDSVIQELGLQHTYSKIGKLEDLVNILDKDLSESIAYIENASKEIKSVLIEIMTNKLERKEPIDVFKLKALGEKLEMDWNLDD